MGLDTGGHQQVASGTAVLTCSALALEAEPAAIYRALGNLHVQGDLVGRAGDPQADALLASGEGFLEGDPQVDVHILALTGCRCGTVAARRSSHEVVQIEAREARTPGTVARTDAF